jgi:malate/lactate dehydrogenase
MGKLPASTTFESWESKSQSSQRVIGHHGQSKIPLMDHPSTHLGTVPLEKPLPQIQGSTVAKKADES